MIQRQTGETISSNFAVHFYLSLRQKIAFLRILPYTFALFYRRNSPFFIFHRTFALFSTAEFYLSSFLIVHLRLSLRRNFTFSISPPYTCAISFGGILPFFISHRTFAPFSTAEFHFFHFPTVHLRHFLRRNFTFLHFPPYICAFLYGGISLFPFPCRTPALFSTAEFRLSSFPAVYFYPFLPQDFTFHGFHPKITAENSSSPLPAVLPYKELFSPSIIFHLKSGEVHPRIIPHPR